MGIPVKADDFLNLLEILVSSGAASLTIEEVRDRLLEREKVEDLSSISAKRAVFPELYRC